VGGAVIHFSIFTPIKQKPKPPKKCLLWGKNERKSKSKGVFGRDMKSFQTKKEKMGKGVFKPFFVFSHTSFLGAKFM
jgi:hypothetical protein